MDWPLVKVSVGLAVCFAALSLSTWEGRALATTLTAHDTAKAKQARQLYKEGQYEDAAKLFSSLSTDYPDKSAFTRNLGACYYHLHRPEPAISNLREYLRQVKNPSPEDRNEVEGWIAEMERLRDHPLSPAAAAPPPEQPPTATAPPAALFPAPALPPPALAVESDKETAKEREPASPATVSPVKSTVVSTQTMAPANEPVSVLPAAAPADAGIAPSEPARSGRGMRVAGVACGAAGLASLGTAVYFYARAVSLSNKVSTSPAPTADEHQAGKNAEALQWVFYSAGGAALATGTLLYYLGWRKAGTTPAATTIAPMVGAGMTGLSAQGAF